LIAEDALSLQQYLKSFQPVMGATNFRTLSDLAFHVNFSQPVSQRSSQDGENQEMVEEAKESDLKRFSDELTQAFRTVMLRFVQTIKSTGR
jgi:hypothetical protein